MLKISKLADYSTVVIAHIAQNPNVLHSAKEIADKTHLKRPTVNKLLKLLTKSGLLISQSGRYGGYSLAREPKQISLMDIITAVEGKMALTSCSHHQGECELEPVCKIQANFQAINQAIYDKLSTISVAALTQPIHMESPIKFIKPEATS